MVQCSIMTQAQTLDRVAADRADRASAHLSQPFPPGEPLGSVMVTEFGGAARAWMRLARRRYQNGVRGMLALAQCRTPQDLIAARADLLCEDLELIRAGCEGVSDVVAGAAGKAVRVIDAKSGD